MFTWLRRLFRGKTLEERLAKLVQVQQEFEEYASMARDRKADKERQIILLQQQTLADAVEIERAELVADNFKALRTHRLMPHEETCQA